MKVTYLVFQNLKILSEMITNTKNLYGKDEESVESSDNDEI